MTPILLLLALLAAPVAAAPATLAPVDEGRFQHFLRVLPDLHSAAPNDAEEAARLARLNPGRERELASALAADAACFAPVREAAMLRMARATADRLGRDKVDRMIAFYEGPDFRRFEALGKAVKDGAEPSPDQRAQLTLLMAAYPLQDFAEAMQASGNVLLTDPALGAGFAKCAQARVEAFTKAGLKE